MKLNKFMLVKRIKEKINCNQAAASLFIDTICEVILEEMLQDNIVSFGNLGIFSIVHRKERHGINPSTKELMLIKPQAKIKFKPFKKIKEQTTEKLCSK